MRMLITMSYNTLMTDDLTEQEVTTIMKALDKSAMVNVENYPKRIKYLEDQTALTVEMIPSHSALIPEKSLREFMREALVAKAHQEEAAPS